MEIEPQCVLLTHYFEESLETISACGILIAQNWVLTNGSLLKSYYHEPAGRIMGDYLIKKSGINPGILVVLPEATAQAFKLKIYYSSITESILKQEIVKEKSCSVRVAWQCPLLSRTFSQIFSPCKWSFDTPFYVSNNHDNFLRSIFLLLRVNNGLMVSEEDTNFKEQAWIVLREFHTKYLEPWDVGGVTRGTSVQMESVPFGSIEFLNSLSRGIVSNVLGDLNCIILSDAIAVPGCEGAPLFIYDPKNASRRQICGLVLSTLTWRNGERMDYTFAANLRVCLRKVLRIPDMGANHFPIKSLPPETVFLQDLLDKCLVEVKCNRDRGTGVVVDVPEGIIITCAHVVTEACLNTPIKVRLSTMKEDEGVLVRLVYTTRYDKPYDVAVLKLEQKIENLRALPIASNVPAKGTQVMTSGFSLTQFPPCSSDGIISRVTSCILQTTCTVQCGDSGGPIIEPNTGQMLGLIVSNIAQSTTGSDTEILYPRFNMSVPATVLKGPLTKYINTQVKEYLHDLTSNDPAVLQAWSLYPMQRSKM
ncbi:peroxisomal leader peptide-processing protease [Copidosoma floridanum]|uniref:peroxisomal leader peptide-processing protease n=1 Tax=Copidosoma floridanum TaxID=29053 RepID=UPI0006C9DAC9|nr:peroxisomal leader peptide-processing protease [Copidosoma floridanum]